MPICHLLGGMPTSYEKIGETVDVAPFTLDYKPISVELVDAALKYECPYSGKVKILIIRRGLHVPSMTHNLLPTFMLREAGIQINEVPKIHVTSPSEEHHAIVFQETTFRIPLTLHGTFSYFPTSKPTTQELEEPVDVNILTPTTWNPHSDAYVMNEESMLDWEGNMKHERDHEKRVVLEDIPSDDIMISSLALCEKEQMAVSSCFVDQDEDIVENSSSLFFQISCSQGILNSSRLSCYLLLRLVVYMYLSQLMRTFTNYLKCIVISS